MSDQNLDENAPQADKRQRSRGQTLVIFAAGLPILLGLLGLGVDGANAYLQNLRMQSAADLAALGGANTLPYAPTAGDYSAARNRAALVASENGYPSGVVAVAPYNGQKYRVEVTITGTVNTFFLPVLGISTVNVQVRGVAGSEWGATGGSVPAIYAACGGVGGSCTDSHKAIDWSGQNLTVTGDVHSNGGVLLATAPNTINGSATANNTFQTVSGNTFQSGPLSGQPDIPPPLQYTASTFAPCDFTQSGTMELKNYYLTGKTLKPGVYCATGSSALIKLDEGYVTGNVTLVSDNKVEISGSNFNLTAYHSTKVLIWANGTGADAVKIAGSDGTWNGIIMAPRGVVEFSGSSNSTVGGGSVLADRVKLAGSNLKIDVTGLSALGPPVREKLQLLE
jgi:Flp pilus assembly protein TadG